MTRSYAIFTFCGIFLFSALGDIKVTCAAQPADLNQDNAVDVNDLAIFVAHWLQGSCNDSNGCGGADIDGSNQVDFFDYALLVNAGLIPPNRPPIVDAGIDQTIYVSDVALSGVVTDDGLSNPPGAVTTYWSIVSGPNTVAFADANAPDTTATLGGPGIYVLRFTANDGELTSYDDVTITYIDLLPTADAGLEYGKDLVSQTPLPSTGTDTITTAQADAVWTTLCSYIQSVGVDGQPVDSPARFIDLTGAGDEFVLPTVNYADTQNTFTLRFYRYDIDPLTIKLQSIAATDSETKTVTIDMSIRKSTQVLQYAIAAQCRIWVTGDSTIHGNIYSSWKYQLLSPFVVTGDVIVDGTINTILSNINPATGQKGPDLYAGTTLMPYHLETLDANGSPIYDAQGNKIISPTDEIQGHCTGINYDINYGDKAVNMPGMKLSDYNTADYKNQTTAPADSSIYNYNHDSNGNPTTPAKVTEYFPHAAGNYNQGISGSLPLHRYVCQNKTLTNLRVTANRNALFQNCTFNGILYVDKPSGSSNNVRFENCTFYGPIVTTPSTDTSSGWWQRNLLYFTGTETFQNQTSVPAAILAPNFNIDLGNTDPTISDNNVLTGAIVGGIVDIRGNARIYGTIISMFDTSLYSSGYISNIGVFDDGSETLPPGDVGTIVITPASSQLLPGGIITPIIIKPLQETYSVEF